MPRSFAIRSISLALSTAFVLAACGNDTSQITTSTTVAPSTTVPGGPIGMIEWTPIAGSVDPGLEATGGTVGGKFYLFGGYFHKTYVATDEADVYDPVSNAWNRLPNVPRALTHTATVDNGRDLILAGGNSTDAKGARIEAVANVYDFNVDTNTWTNLPDLPSPRAGGGMAKIGSMLHYFSGVDVNRKEQRNHWILDLNNTAAGWKSEGAFPFAPRTHMQTTSIGNNIYVMGGLVGIDQNSTDFADTWKFDSVTKKWTQQANMPMPLSHASDATVVYNGRVWLFGGEIGYNQTRSAVLVYDPASNTWTRNTDLPGLRFAGNAVNIDGVFYFTRGSMDSMVSWKGKLNY